MKKLLHEQECCQVFNENITQLKLFLEDPALSNAFITVPITFNGDVILAA